MAALADRVALAAPGYPCYRHILNVLGVSPVSLEAGPAERYQPTPELLRAATHHLDAKKKIDDRLAPSRAAKTGEERLDAFVMAWAGYIPEIYGMAKALMAMADTDEAAAETWNTRMQDMREGCLAAVQALDREGQLHPGLAPDAATDLLWTLLSVRNWEQLTQSCGWSQADYLQGMRSLTRRLLTAPRSEI